LLWERRRLIRRAGPSRQGGGRFIRRSRAVHKVHRLRNIWALEDERLRSNVRCLENVWPLERAWSLERARRLAEVRSIQDA